MDAWFDHIALSPAYPDLRDEHYDLAVGGATVWPGAKAFGLPNVSFPDQVDVFERYFVNSRNPEKPKWDNATSLFSVFIGINDISYRWWQRGSILPHLRQTLGVYDSQIGRLYKAGARTFLLFKVPPYERSPIVSLIDSVVENTRNNVDVSAAALNKDLELYVDQAPEKYPGADFRLFDTVEFFDDVLDNAKSKYGFENDDGWCPWYSLGMYKANVPPALSLKECSVPLEKYLWYDGVHPTWSVHRLLAAAVQRFLSREGRTEQSVQRRDAILDDFPVDQAVDAAAAEEEYRRLYVRQRQLVPHAPKRFFHLKRTLTPVLG
ncbi:hypothetical protein Rhopal_000358-T1 [Rhodotorula paludigena]|uniref:Uncharacterized protein n=1 Tax=Rhodotorula paludigena TaxID=86838 RepID=A0AAV5GDH1_9BASI|nr:hypothetical protein Rhopal_000358-T1 [Rhodotorula paludigena]